MKHYVPGEIKQDGTVDMHLSKRATLKQMLADTKAISNRVRLLNKASLLNVLNRGNKK
jgi:hypothetical protein